MLRVITSIVSGCLLFGCQASEPGIVVVIDEELSPTSFSESVNFPVGTVMAVDPVLDMSCTMAYKTKIVPIYAGDEFLSFRYQDCEPHSVSTIVDQGSVEIIWEMHSPFGKPFQYKTLPLKIETGNTKPPKDYLDGLYTTDGERRYCKASEKSSGIWEIKNIEISPIPRPSKLHLDPELFKGLSRNDEIKQRLEIYEKHHAEHYKKFEHQDKINRICGKLPTGSYFFFEGEYVLIMPRYYTPILDITSIKYHRK